ncbi:MAG: UDP-N-acetylglucosamine diphosphorylase/glucosamine-1-phosphate N-acetyltransferase [Deltaproteobacteria bacterium]|nr:MAG: UDP-N-acetylglucosamine diphosphorylase/glucosamine-1-phosphate N-acetyltransferase [Deltaproteobacteria bacterium]
MARKRKSKRSKRRGSDLAAIVLAAGQGTRMKSRTAKVLHPLCGRPLAYFPVAAATGVGARPVVVVVGHQAAAVEAALSSALPEAPLCFALQAEPRGTGDAVAAGLGALEGAPAQRILILNGDLPLLTVATLRRLLRAGREAPLALLTARPPSPKGYGRIVRDGRGQVISIVEEADADAKTRRIEEVNAGVYLVERALLERALGGLEADNAQGELYLTDLVAIARRLGQAVVGVPVPEWSEVAGVNDRAELAEAAAALRRRIVEAWLRRGVSFEDPGRTYVDVGVRLGRDTLVAPGVHLCGETRIGASVRIGTGAVLRDVEVGAEAVIEPYSVLEGAVVGRGARVGPFARLRPGTRLGPEARIGNFVETKKAHLGKGAKANHLTYLGDATVGPGCNIGAGTITCNYDGREKHPTVLESDVFIGSNTALVAPVRVGRGALVGAGSVIVRDVPADALAIARAPQRTVAGWARRFSPHRKKRR